MAVTQVKQLAKAGGGLDIDAKNWRIEHFYYVQLSAPSATAAMDVMTASAGGVSIPSIGDPYGGAYSTLICTHVGPPRDLGGKNKGINWEVPVTYGVNTTVIGSTTVAPWDRRPLIDWDVARYPYVLEKDFANEPKPVLNSADDPFDPPIMTERINSVANYRFAKQTALVNIDSIQDLIGTINASQVSMRGYTIAAKKGLLRSATARASVWTNGTYYYDVVYRIEIENQVPLEKISVLDKGYHYLKLADNSKDLIKLNGVPVSSPQLLDGEGYPLDPGVTPIYKDFVLHKAASWLALGLT